MRNGMKAYRYCPVNYGTEISTINRNMAKAGVVLGGLVVGGYYLYRKVTDLTKEVKKLKEEMGK